MCLVCAYSICELSCVPAIDLAFGRLAVLPSMWLWLLHVSCTRPDHVHLRLLSGRHCAVQITSYGHEQDYQGTCGYGSTLANTTNMLLNYIDIG